MAFSPVETTNPPVSRAPKHPPTVPDQNLRESRHRRDDSREFKFPQTSTYPSLVARRLREDLAEVDNLTLLSGGTADTLADSNAGQDDGNGSLAATHTLAKAFAPVSGLPRLSAMEVFTD